MPGVKPKPKVGPKKMRRGGAAKKTKELKLPSGGGSGRKPVPKGNTGLAKLPKGVRNKMGFMSNGGAAKKKPVKKARGGPASVNMDLMKGHGLTREDLQQIGEDYSAALSKKTGTGKYASQKITGSKRQQDLATALKGVDSKLFGQMFPEGTVTVEEIYPPQKKARGGAVKKPRKMRSGGSVGCGSAKRGFGAVKRGR